MSIGKANINIQAVLTKEQIDYEEALKNMKRVSARLKISQEGVDVQKISQDELDNAIKMFDEMEIIQRDFNIEAQKAQQEINNKMKSLQDSANKKFADVQNRYRELMESMRRDDTVGIDYGDIEEGNIIMSKEREEEIERELAEMLAKARSENAE